MSCKKTLFILAAGIAILCGCDAVNYAPAPVINLGLHSDSKTGAMMATEGDNLWDIAKRYRLPVREIIDMNGLEPPYHLSEGQRLKLPAPVDYRVQYRDTLQTVASMFGVSISQLVHVNKIKPPFRLSPGQVLRIPSALREEMASAAVMQKPLRAPVPDKPTKKADRPVFAPAPVMRQEMPAETTLKPSQRPDFVWPVRGKVISGYGPKEDGLFNDGINIAAPRGTSVTAAADGTVAYVGNDLKSYGNLVLIRHKGGTMTAYAHLASVKVKRGMPVHKGQSVGTVGATGAVPAAQLHFEIRQGSKTYDPRKYLG